MHDRSKCYRGAVQRILGDSTAFHTSIGLESAIRGNEIFTIRTALLSLTLAEYNQHPSHHFMGRGALGTPLKRAGHQGHMWALPMSR